MNALVGYGSSDEEDDEIKPEKPAKIPKTAALDPALTTSFIDVPPVHLSQDAAISETAPSYERTRENTPVSTGAVPEPATGHDQTMLPEVPPIENGTPLDAHAYERQRIRELTMPTVPNFDIPNSPPLPLANSEEAAALAVTTKKFERFLELKKQGIHFNERLQNSSSLRNPSLLPKLLDFASISNQESYESSLPEEVAVPSKWPEECYVGSLIRQNGRWEKKRRSERDKVDFVPATKSAGSRAAGTPAKSAATGRKSRFDQR